MTKDAKRAVLYLRVSTESQTNRDGDAEGYSIPAQREGCLRKAAELGAEVVGEYSDPGISGRTAKRPGLQAMLARIATTGDIDYVVVWKLSRLSRSPLLDATLELELIEHQVRLVSVTENIDETPGGKLLRRILGTINAYEIDNLAQGVSAGMARKTKTGGTAGAAALGYLNVAKLVDGNEVRTVIVDPDRAPLIQWAFRAYSTGTYTITSLLRAVTEKGLTTKGTKKRPSKPLGRAALARALSNPYYAGTLRYKGAEYPGRHEALVSQQLFDSVQQVLKANQTGEKVQSHPHFLKGSIYCARCLSRFSLTYAKGKSGGIYPYFFCLGRQGGNGCDQRYLGMQKVEDLISNFYRTQRLDPAVGEKLRRGFRAQLREDQSRIKAESARQTKRLEELKTQRRKLLDLHYGDQIAADLFAEEQERINREMRAATKSIEEAAWEWSEIGAANDLVFDQIEDMGNFYASLTDEKRRRLNRALWTKLLIDSERPVTAEFAEPPSWEWLERYLKRARQTAGVKIGARAIQLLKAANPAVISSEVGSNIVQLVGPQGLEPCPPD